MRNLYGSTELTARERIVVTLVAEGLTNREVAKVIGSTEHMVKNYLRVIYDKLGVWNRVELALWQVAREPKQERAYVESPVRPDVNCSSLCQP